MSNVPDKLTHRMSLERGSRARVNIPVAASLSSTLAPPSLNHAYCGVSYTSPNLTPELFDHHYHQLPQFIIPQCQHNLT
jgi:hypothetical protein